jgi:hypothetical protein
MNSLIRSLRLRDSEVISDFIDSVRISTAGQTFSLSRILSGDLSPITFKLQNKNLRLQRILTCFKKMTNPHPLMGAKVKSKTHLLNTLFDFLSRFLFAPNKSYKQNKFDEHK